MDFDQFFYHSSIPFVGLTRHENLFWSALFFVLYTDGLTIFFSNFFGGGPGNSTYNVTGS